jgi:hypothetical protein
MLSRTFAISLAAFAASPALAQQQADPNQGLALEWQALQLQQSHAEQAINRLIAAYELRLATAMVWLQAAQAAVNEKR